MNQARLQVVSPPASVADASVDYVIETEKLELRFGKVLALEQLDLG